MKIQRMYKENLLLAALLPRKISDTRVSRRGSLKAKSYKNIVFIGASITEGAFGRDLVNPNQEATDELGIDGINVYGWGWGGNTIGSYLAGDNHMQEALDAFPSDTLFHIHLGGNDLSQNRPWGSVDAETKAEIKDNYSWLMDVIGDRKDDCIFSPITFRDYDDVARFDETLSSLPFNTEVILPYQNEKFENSDGYPITDWYGWAVNNQGMFHTDGVHMTPEGYRVLRKDSVKRLKLFLESKQLPSTFDHTIPHIPSINSTSYAINFGISPVHNNQGTSTDVVNNTPVSLLRNDRVNSDITWSAQALDPNTGIGLGYYDFYCGVNYNNTLQSDPFYKDTLFIKSGNSITHTLSGFSPNQLVKIEFVGYREAGSDRFTEIIDLSDNNNKVDYNTSTGYPQQSTEITIQSDGSGSLSFLMQAKSGSSFGYLSGMMITPL